MQRSIFYPIKGPFLYIMTDAAPIPPVRNYKEEPGGLEKLWSFFKPIFEYGKEDRDAPDFRWHKYIIRTVVLNLVAGYIAFRATNMLLEMQSNQQQGMAPSATPQKHYFQPKEANDVEF